MLGNTLTIKNNKFISEEETFFRYALIMEYIGSEFSGSQKQPGKITVQSEIEKAIKKLLQTEVNVIFSGRTDKGVHARNQAAHINVPVELNIHRFLYSLNAILPEYICVKNIQKVDKTFHSQKSAKFRWYRYTINNRPQRSVWLNKTSLHVYEKLNIESMQIALKFLEGRHDFSSFKKANTPNPAKECHMHYAGCRGKDNIINIDLIANRFLYNMVRIIIGTLIEIGKGIYPPEHMLRVLNAKNRISAGHTVEAHGLTFMLVGYDEKYQINTTNMTMETNNNENLLSKAS